MIAERHDAGPVATQGKELYDDESCRRLDGWMDGRRNVDLDGGRHPGGSPASRRYHQAVQKIILRGAAAK